MMVYDKEAEKSLHRLISKKLRICMAIEITQAGNAASGQVTGGCLAF
jgi:hypothetical protein